ncbi:MAG: hypothetical protein ABSF83_03390 [Nitrososphaerales archaeon]|jgi:hypothetical protein
MTTTAAVRPSQEGHWPNLQTLLMIERAIKEAEIPPKRTELWRSLPKRPMYQTFKKAVEYLEASGKVMIDRNDRVVWVAVESPKLQELFDRAVPLR